jgi:hypothetical protein
LNAGLSQRRRNSQAEVSDGLNENKALLRARILEMRQHAMSCRRIAREVGLH